MPELPEVQTTVNGIRHYVVGKSITDVWTDYGSSFHYGKSNIKNKKYFPLFRKDAVGRKIEGAERIGKNVIIHLSGGMSIVVHMKMTGHLMYGTYFFDGKMWSAIGKGPLRDDPFNKWIHLVFTLSNNKHLVLSDLRKFAKVHSMPTKELFSDKELRTLGPDPLSPSFTIETFRQRLLLRPRGKIKQILMNPAIIAGIGNIYSDEMLWRAGIHPLSEPQALGDALLKKLFKAGQEVLKKGIDFGGDSMSDYRNILGQEGKFQSTHEAYRRTGKPCSMCGCGGTIERLKVGGRSGHYCNKHQKLCLDRQ